MVITTYGLVESEHDENAEEEDEEVRETKPSSSFSGMMCL